MFLKTHHHPNPNLTCVAQPQGGYIGLSPGALGGGPREAGNLTLLNIPSNLPLPAHLPSFMRSLPFSGGPSLSERTLNRNSRPIPYGRGSALGAISARDDPNVLADSM